MTETQREDNGTRARAAGKAATTARTVWSVELGPLVARCLREPDGTYLIQGRTSSGWVAIIGRGPDALALLRTLVASKAVGTAVDSRANALVKP